MKRKLFTILGAWALGFIYLPLFGQNISGTYTIGTALGTEDYSTIAAAVADLKSGTITGDVTYDISAGTYNETVDLSSINNGSFTITFTGAGKESTIVHPLDGLGANASGIVIENTNHVVLNNFTLEMDDIADTPVDYEFNEARGINVSGASDITLENLILSNADYVLNEEYDVDIATALSLIDVADISVSSSDFSGSGILIYLDDFDRVHISESEFSDAKHHIYHSRTGPTQANELTITDNAFTGPFPGGFSAIYLRGFYTDILNDSYGTNLSIENNVIDLKMVNSNDDVSGIWVTGQVGPEIRNNVVEDCLYGLYVRNCLNAVVESNQVYRATNTAFYLHGGQLIEVYNNVLHSSVGQGMHTVNIENLRLLHNTLHGGGSHALNLYSTSGDSLVVRNNIFSVDNTAETEVRWYIIISPEIKIDNNLYSGNANTYTATAYRVGADIGQENGLQLTAATFSDWQTGQTLYDQNSQSFAPVFAGPEDFHITSDKDYRFGHLVTNVSNDIDGDYRDPLVGFDVGADQYCSTACVPLAAPVVSGFTPAKGPIGSTILVAGSNFSPIAGNNLVKIAGVQAKVTSATSDFLSVEVPIGASAGQINVNVNGLQSATNNAYQVTFESNGTFDEEDVSDPFFFETGTRPFRGIAADFDGDGLLDIASSNYGGQDVSILRNSSSGIGDINFESHVTFTVGSTPNGLVSADFDGDGKNDLASANTGSGTISILRNTGVGNISFASKVDLQATARPKSLAAGDIDNDGKVDIVAIDEASDVVSVFRNVSTGAGDISFAAKDGLATAGDPSSITLADIDTDGKLDILIANYNGKSMSILLNESNGGSISFGSRQDYPINGLGSHIAAGDMDGDGVLDIAVSAFIDLTSSGTSLHIALYHNESSPGSLSFNKTTIENIHSGWMTMNDLNGDGLSDIIISQSFNGLSFIINESTIGNISFEPEVPIWPPDVYPVSVVSADLDNDQEPDMFMLGLNDNQENLVEIYRNLGSGTSFKSFGIEAQSSSGRLSSSSTELLTKISETAHTVEVWVPENTDRTAMTASFDFSQSAAIVVDGVEQISGVTVNDFTNPLTYTITAEDGEVQDWNVTLSEACDVVEENVTACESYEFDGQTLTSSGLYDAVLTNSIGCDSLVTLNLIINQSDQVQQNVTVCDSYVFDGRTLTASGRYQAILTNQQACDSVVTLNLTISDPPMEEEEVSACESYEWQDEVYTTSGEYEIEDIGDDSCPVIRKLILTILEPTTSEAEVEACESYEWNGTTYTASGTYQELLINAAGCDSTATLNLTILEPTSGADEVSACSSYLWEGDEFTTTGVYQKTLVNAVGCDSLATLDLTILEPTSSFDEVTHCDSYEWGGELYSASGTYQQLLTNAAGCDSTATLDLTILVSTTGQAAVEACGSYEWEGSTYDASGIYETLLTNQAGCDSTATLNLTILPEPNVELEVVDDGLTLSEINAGDTYQWYDCLTDLPIDGATDASFAPIETGEYYVEVNNGQCTVNSACAEATLVVTSVSDYQEPEIRLYPNPASDRLNIELGKYYEQVQLEIMDVSGKRLQTSTAIGTDRLQVAVGQWTGIIMVRISTSAEVVLQSRVLVK